MGKTYYDYIMPKDAPKYKTRRILFVLAVGMFIVNLLVLAFAHVIFMREALIAVVFSVAIVVIQCVDNRVSNWTWGHVVALCIIFFLGGVVLFIQCILCGEKWYFLLYGIEVLIYGAVIFFLLRKKTKKRRNR